jgi:hypothetical protein
MNKIDLKHLASYEEDFALWSAEQAALLRAGKLDRLDIENVAEEVESLGKGQKHEIQSRLTVILTHLLKWQFQPDASSRSWISSIAMARIEIARVLEDSPSLAQYPLSVLERSYRNARKVALLETKLPPETLPMGCPYSVEQVLDDDFWPGHAP